MRPVRVDWVDIAKGLGIILVVFGHVIRGLVNGNVWMWTTTSHFIDGWIYAFHMPLFFFLSGLFLVRSAEKPWLKFITEKIRTLAYPYFVWSVITILVKTPMSGITNHSDEIAELPLIVYAPIEQYWFLYVLFILFRYQLRLCSGSELCPGLCLPLRLLFTLECCQSLTMDGSS